MKSLIVWNGMFSEQISGGDNYTLKFIKLSDLNPDIILSKTSREFLSKKDKYKMLFTMDNFSNSIFSLIILYIIRIIQSIYFIKEERERYDISISSSPFLFDTFPLIFADSKKRGVFLFHIIPKRKAVNFKTWIRFFLAGFEKKISYFIIRKYFDIVMVGNEDVRQELIKIFPEKKIIIADAGFDVKKIDAVNNFKKDANQGCFTGRLVSQKGVLDLIDIMKKINEKNPKFRLIVIGDGPEKDELKARIKKERIKSIILKGFVSEKEKYEILKKSKFFFFPSYEEGWGISLGEALYCNCLAICYEIDFYKSVFGNFPVYVNVGDKDEFVKRFFENYNSKVKRNQRDYMRKYDDKNVIKEIVQKISLDSK